MPRRPRRRPRSLLCARSLRTESRLLGENLCPRLRRTTVTRSLRPVEPTETLPYDSRVTHQETRGSMTQAGRIDGREVAQRIYSEVESGVAALKATGVAPHLVAIQVGGNEASSVYVQNQKRRSLAPGNSVHALGARRIDVAVDPRLSQVRIARRQPDGHRHHPDDAAAARDPCIRHSGVHPGRKGRRGGPPQPRQSGTIDLQPPRGRPVHGARDHGGHRFDGRRTARAPRRHRRAQRYRRKAGRSLPPPGVRDDHDVPRRDARPLRSTRSKPTSWSWPSASRA